MFGKEPKTEANPIVERMRAQGGRLHVKEEDAPEEHVSPAAVIFPAWLLIAGAFFAANMKGAGALPFQLPHVDKRINTLLFGAQPPSLIGDATADAALAAAAQALLVCLVAGALPLCVHVWRRLRDNVRGSVYISFWGVSVLLPFLFFFLRDFLWPILSDLFGGI